MRLFSRFPYRRVATIIRIAAMQTIARFYKGEDAYLCRSFLESEGISAHVFDEYTPQVHWLYTHVIGGIRVVVSEEDAEEAAKLYWVYEENMIAAPPVVGNVKAWPFMLMISICLGFPMYLLGRKRADE